MKVRTGLMVSFAYVLFVVIVALTVPLAIVLRDRARSELEALALTNAQTIAALLDQGRLAGDPAAARTLARDARRYANDVGGRVVVLDAKGTVIADSDLTDLGQNWITRGRPEVGAAFDSRATALFRNSVDAGGNIVVAAAPIIDEQRLVGVVRISRDVQQVQANVTRATAGIVIVALASVVAGLAIAFALAGRLAGPLTRLASTARRLGRGDLSSRAGRLEGADELKELSASFDEMADRLERTVRAQREFVANASHQLRTPLTGMKLRLEAAAGDAPSDAIAANLQAADREVDRLAEIVDRLLLMARRAEEGDTEVADLPHVVARAVERWSERAAASGSALQATGDGGLALANPSDLDQLLDALIDNAIAYAPGPIEVGASRDGDRMVLAVQDHGPGIPTQEQSRVTERFFRGTNAPPGGSGLGLAIARQLAEASGGTLRVDGTEHGGTRIEILLRPADESATPEPGS